MPNIANITVKKNDGTTDIIWSYVQPASGDSSPAVWRSQTVGSAIGHQPSYVMKARNNGPRTARRVEGEVVYPTLVTGSDGRINVADKFILQVNGVIPLGMPSADLNEAVSQSLNLLAATLTKDSFKTGFAPS